MTGGRGREAGGRRGLSRGGRGVPEAIAIVGATGTGKSELAVEVARRLGGEVISVDSRQAYRGFEVGTAAPAAAERRGVPHHGVGFLEPGEPYGAGRFARLARRWVREIRGRARVPIFAGGTGLFLDVLLHPVFREPRMEEERRRRLRAWLRGLGPEELRRWAGRLDPELFRRLAVVDRQRASRTLELALLSGRPLTWWQERGEPDAPALRLLCFLLELPPDLHRDRIRQRAERLLEAGWEEEARRLLEAGGERSVAADAVGYREIFALLRGELGREKALERIVRATWGYARRQRTWFRHHLPGEAERLDGREPVGQLARRIVDGWRRATARREGKRCGADRGATGSSPRPSAAGEEASREGPEGEDAAE